MNLDEKLEKINTLSNIRTEIIDQIENLKMIGYESSNFNEPVTLRIECLKNKAYIPLNTTKVKNAVLNLVKGILEAELLEINSQLNEHVKLSQ